MVRKKKKKSVKKKGTVVDSGELSAGSVSSSSDVSSPTQTGSRRARLCGDAAVALYDYEAESEGEISFEVGDVIKSIRRDWTGWWEGEVNGKRGYFPVNYVREVQIEEDKTEDWEEFSDMCSSLDADEAELFGCEDSEEGGHGSAIVDRNAGINDRHDKDQTRKDRDNPSHEMRRRQSMASPSREAEARSRRDDDRQR